MEFLVVAECGRAEDFGLQAELHEVLRLLTLHEHFGAFDVDGEVELALLRGVEGVGLFDKLPPPLRQQRTQLVGLCGGERSGKGVDWWHRQEKRARGGSSRNPKIARHSSPR